MNNQAASDYKYGFYTDIETEDFPKGLDEGIVEQISAKKNEPSWLLDWRIKSYRQWTKMIEPSWAKIEYPPIDFQNLYYYSAPKQVPKLESLDEVDPELLATFDRLGIPLSEQKRISGVAVDAVFDSVSVGTTYKEELAECGVVFCSFSEAVQDHPELIKKYLGTVVPRSDNFYAALNGAVFSDGSFAWIPKGVTCPLDLSTYFRINAKETGQFERTLVVAEEGSFVNYLEGCTAPQRDENQLHAAVVELVAKDNATIRYATVQNWYAGNQKGEGGIYNFVTKRGNCLGKNSFISWTQVEAGSAITWKYPSCNLIGDNSPGRLLFGRPHQQQNAGRHRFENGSYRQEHPLHHHFQGHQLRRIGKQLPGTGENHALGKGCPQLLPVRLHAGRGAMRGRDLSLHRCQKRHRHRGTRGFHHQDQ